MRIGSILVAALVTAMFACVPAFGSATQESVFQDDDLLIHVSPAQADRTMGELAQLGVDRVRLSAIWKDIAPATRPADPTDPAAYDQRKLEHLDTAIRTAQAHGIGVLLNARGGVPGWAMPPLPKRFAGRDAYKPDPALFRDFVQMLGRRYSGGYRNLPRVDFWSIWNEPNWGSLLHPQAVRNRRTRRLQTVSPYLYRQLYRAATAGLAASGHGSDRVLIGETAPIGRSLGHLSPMKPARFLRDLFCLDRRLRPLEGAAARRLKCDFDVAGPLRATGYGHHAYSVMDPPAVPSKDRGLLRLGDLPRLVGILDAAAAAGRIPAGMPVWLTEYGYQTQPDPYRGIDPVQHAAWLVEAEHLTWANPRVASSAQFLLQDDEPRTAFAAGTKGYWGTYQSGLKFGDGTPKPAYEAYRLPLYAPTGLQPGQPLPLWGMVRPGPNGEPQRVRIEYRERPDAPWVALPEEPRTDAMGYFSVTVPAAQGGEYRFQWLRAEADNQVAPRSGGASVPIATG